MLNYGFVFLFLIHFTFCSVISSSPPFLPDILGSEEYLRIILAYAFDELNVRLVSKAFKAGFDGACAFEVISLDPRFRTLTIIPSPIKIPVQIPLLYLLKDIIGKKFIETSNVILNEDYPLVQDQKINERNDFDRFADILTEFIDHEFFDSSVYDQEKWEPKRLYDFYRFVQLALPQKDFTTEILPSINFPMNKLLTFAAAGEFPGAINHNLLSKHQELIRSDSGLIFVAFKASRLDLVRVLISLPSGGVKLKNMTDDESRSILHYAAHFGDLDLVEQFLNLGCNINKIDSKREKAVHKAAAKGHVHVVKYLYQRNAVINSLPYNPSPIFKAVANNHLNVVLFILYETNFISSDETEKTFKFNYELILLAVENNNYEMVSSLLNSRKLSFDQNVITKLLKKAQRFQNIDFRIERLLESTNSY